MKYVTASIAGKEMIFIFPKDVRHDYFAEMLEALRFGDDHNWERPFHPRYDDGKILSAGFITGGKCHGRSETLNLASRDGVDTLLLKGN